MIFVHIFSQHWVRDLVQLRASASISHIVTLFLLCCSTLRPKFVKTLGFKIFNFGFVSLVRFSVGFGCGKITRKQRKNVAFVLLNGFHYCSVDRLCSTNQKLKPLCRNHGRFCKRIKSLHQKDLPSPACSLD
ncbi:hypothetical protein RJT34_27609 [Clitoria ternatea]|uniref:Uncharacterized protein n=1 Tax=Clitoria ternatea TaxID=43366 RepID=A0AAN9I9T8_CLITE